MIAKSSLLFLFLLFVLPQVLPGQNRSQLEEKRKKAEEQIEFTKKLINETTQQQRQTVKYLGVLNEQIRSREELIQAISSEIGILNENIRETQGVVDAMERDLLQLKEEYAKLVYYAYKNHSAYNELVFIFSAESFNAAYQRLKFLQYFTEYRKKQIELIKETQEALSFRMDDLQAQIADKRSLLAKQTDEKQELEQDKSSKGSLVSQLKSKNQELQRQLREEQAAKASLDKAIKDIIEAEIKASRAKSGTAGTSYALTPEAAKLSADFTTNKAKLPWPVEKGFISQTFGEHSHPDLPGVKTYNNGVDFQTSKGALARAVFNGEVVRVIRLPGQGTAVMMKHGDYFTVYGNLAQVVVKPGDQVKTKQTLGVVNYNPKTGASELHFEIWKNFEKMNPQTWLYR
ncbi:MAG: peptidoglycan DD-metalloendopeptidase family protein [Bacteroidia bacterium]